MKGLEKKQSRKKPFKKRVTREVGGLAGVPDVNVVDLSGRGSVST